MKLLLVPAAALVICGEILLVVSVRSPRVGKSAATVLFVPISKSETAV